jgi:hypothetical protein
MKKFSLFLIILGFLSICQAQNITPGNFIDHNSFSKFKNQSLSHERGLVWRWDTVVTYDTSGTKYRYYHSFDSNGKIEIQTTDSWVIDQWKLYNKSKIDHTFDNNGSLLVELIQDWQYTKWVNSTRYTHTYDSNAYMLSEILEVWQSNAWINLVRHSFTYDSNGNKLTEIGETWKNKAWCNSYRATNKYDKNGNIITTTGEYWQVDDWYKSSIDTFFYNSSSQLIKTITRTWYNTKWNNDYQNNFTYDSYGNMLICLGETWKDSIWVNAYRETYSYDNNGNSLTGIVESWLNSNWNKYQGNLNLYYVNGEVAYFFNGLYRYEAQFRSYTNSIDKISIDNDLISVYPNPSNDKITIQITQVKPHPDYNLTIYNIQGKAILQHSIRNNNTEINISTLPRGVYVMYFTNQGSSILKKFIKE